jgi:hypothetical protein
MKGRDISSVGGSIIHDSVTSSELRPLKTGTFDDKVFRLLKDALVYF